MSSCYEAVVEWRAKKSSFITWLLWMFKELQLI